MEENKASCIKDLVSVPFEHFARAEAERQLFQVSTLFLAARMTNPGFAPRGLPEVYVRLCDGVMTEHPNWKTRPAFEFPDKLCGKTKKCVYFVALLAERIHKKDFRGT